MVRMSAEAICISALLNNQDVLAGQSYGLSPVHFVGYQSHYNWLLNYQNYYKTEPSKEAFSEAFPDFRYGEHEDIRSAVDMVFKAFAKRNLTEAMTEAMENLQLGDVQTAYSTLVAAEPQRTNAKPRRLLTDLDFLDDWETGSSAIYTPYRTLDRVTGGMKPGQLWYLSARPKNGKSAHLVNMVKHAVLAGNRVKFYSLEMSEPEVRGRFHAALAHHYGYKGITLTAIRDKSIDLFAYKQFVTELQDRIEAAGGGLDIHTPKDGLVTPALVNSAASEYHLNVVDYVGLMRADGGGRTQEWQTLAGISNDLKLGAAASGTTYLCASQINREGEQGKEPPKLANLAGSDALGQDGDVILTMRAQGHQNVATCMSVEGNRHGPSAKFYTRFDPNRGDFTEITSDEAESLVMDSEEE